MPQALLDEALEWAEAVGDRRTRSYALLVRGNARTHLDPAYTAEQGLSEANEALRVFEELGDDRGQACAWGNIGHCHWFRGHHGAGLEAWERALAHAVAARDERIEADARVNIGVLLFFGATPLEDAVSYAKSLLDQPDGRFRGRQVHGLIGRAHAMRGDFETARKVIAERIALQEDLGKAFGVIVLGAMELGEVEMLAGDPAAAEEYLRRGYRALEEAGESGLLSSVAAMLANAVHCQGVFEDAERFTRISEETAARDDYSSQILWRFVRAKAIANGGRLAEGEQLAREAVAFAEDTDDINLHGDALMALAEVLQLAERPDEAAPFIDQALRLYEQKGNLVSAGEARSLLAAL